jgi:transporter family-2 protein
MHRSVGAWPLIAAFAVGALTAVQSRANGSLALVVGSGIQAAAISFSVGLILISIAVILMPRLRSGVHRLFTVVKTGQLPWWSLFGGFFGALFVLSQSLTVPVMGVAVFAVALVSGQSAASLVVDRLGIGPHGRQPMTGHRVAAAAVGVVAVVVAVSPRISSGNFSAPLVVLTFIAGLGIALQQAFSGRVSTATREPIVAAWVNFILGTALLLLALAVSVIVGWVQLGDLPAGPWWLYLGGVVGAIFIAVAAWVAARAGVLVLALLSIAGQLTSSLGLDALFLDGVDLALVFGVVLSYLAVLINVRGNVNSRR